jgi:hypothetical protein
MRRLPIALPLLVAIAGCGAATPTAGPASTAAPTEAPTEAPTPSRPAACKADQLTGAVISWEGAAGHQIASVVLTAKAGATCVIQGTPQLQLVDAIGLIVIDSVDQGDAGLAHVADGDPAILLASGEAVRTLVSVANYCSNVAATLPTTIAMVLPSDGGRIVLDPGPGGDVPACMSSPGDPGSIEMNGWTR